MNVKNYIIKDSSGDKIRLTRTGVDRLRPWFSKYGIDPNKIKTKSQFLSALDIAFTSEMETLAKTDKGKNKELDQLFEDFPGWD